ncbi:M48 family metalloprotease [Psychrobacter alimentarius]|uniref:M48 family metalloprotease n=1 Tax=Psychrobacter alimentarius TaxID=261164 RepID=UPI00191A0835|nr:M48 family metalloprotease [Psychrobacter alimentarius]
MDFFGAQRIRTKRSLLLYGLFFIIVFAHMAVALAVMALLLTLFTDGIYHWVLVLVTIWILGTFIGGSFLEYRRLKAGGRAIAQRVGAVRLFIDRSQDEWEQSRGIAHQHIPMQKVRYSARHIAVRDERDLPSVYRRYYEIAQQLAIASGVPMPILYVLPYEQGINGFVAGRHHQDMVLVVTQGALDKLSDEGLYGLIGHEYGHILHGDARFNLKLMVVLAGLQILYDWSDPFNNTGSRNNSSDYFESAGSRHVPLSQMSQRTVDTHARRTEAQTGNFKSHSDWIAYWQAQSQRQQSQAKQQSRWLPNRAASDWSTSRSAWALLLHAFSFSSMASAQLIKHSFNRERELLADATSVQLTRSPAIIETLKTIHQDAIGSRLTGIGNLNGLSHFFFASSGADLGDVSWLATHPSLAERMTAINTSAYHSFAIKIAKEKQLNQQKIKQIYEQRRLGNWEATEKNSLSKSYQEKTALQSQILSSNQKIKTPADEQLLQTPNNTNDSGSGVSFGTLLEHESGLEFVTETDVIVDGRLQVSTLDTDSQKLLKPWQAKSHSELPNTKLVTSEDVKRAALPQYIIDHSHHPLGAQALIEAVMLCHQGQMLSTAISYDLTAIWYQLPTMPVGTDNNAIEAMANAAKILPHKIDSELLEKVASLDRRLDSTLITLAIKQLNNYDLSKSAIDALRLKYENQPDNPSYQYYIRQKKCRTMLERYQEGMLALLKRQLTTDLSEKFAHHVIGGKTISDTPQPTLFLLEDNAPSMLSLWQALHMQLLLPSLFGVLNDKQLVRQAAWQQALQAGRGSILIQLDPSGQIFEMLCVARQAILILLAYRLSKDIKGQMISALDSSTLYFNHASVAHYIVDLRRHARLIDIDLATVSDANLQWLLLTAQSLNGVQLLALIQAVPIFIAPISASHQYDSDQEKPQNGLQIDYNKHTDSTAHPYVYNDYRQWLSTLHTMMLHDTIVSQDEYDCLVLLSEHWLGVRQLF